jgi:hypothetical protein
MDNNRNRIDYITDVDWVQYKLCKVIDKTATDIHHIMWKCNRNKYNTNIDKNKVKINRRLHVALNSFFGDKQNPRDQLKQVFEIVKPVLSEWVKKELYTILYEADDDLFYTPELLKWKKKKKQKIDTNSHI